MSGSCRGLNRLTILNVEILYDYSYCTKNNIIFVKLFDMKTDLRLMMLTDLEADLIAAARNYVKSYPDGYPELLWYLQELFDELIDVF